MGEKVNEGYYRFWTRALQKEFGIIEAEIRAYFDTSLVKMIAENFGECVKIVDMLGEYEILQTSDDDKCKEIANRIDRAIRKAAVQKARTAGIAKKIYEVLLTSDDVKSVLEEV